MISSFQQEIKFSCQATNCFLKSLSVVCLLIAKFFNNLIFWGKTNVKDKFSSWNLTFKKLAIGDPPRANKPGKSLKGGNGDHLA